MRINHALLYRDGCFRPGSIEFGKTVEGFAEGEGLDAGGAYLVPGFIDIHTHGAVGVDASDCSAGEIPTLAGHYASHGVTSFCFTTMTVPAGRIENAMVNIRGYRRSGNQAKVAGVHLEGPFLSYEKRGAQAPENILPPSLERFAHWNALSGGLVRLITVAPELDGALDFIREASKVCAVSLGHSAADYETAMKGFEAGAAQATHLFNGMEPLHHRRPGLIGAAFDAGAGVELICDGMHIHPSVVRMVHAAFGRRLCIISDSLRCAGLPDGEYESAGHPIVVREGRAALTDGTLAGSTTNLLSELRNVVRWGVPLEDAVFAVSEAPARAIRAFDRIGSLEIGKAADFLLLDDKLELLATFIDGELVNGGI